MPSGAFEHFSRLRAQAEARAAERRAAILAQLSDLARTASDKDQVCFPSLCQPSPHARPTLQRNPEWSDPERLGPPGPTFEFWRPLSR